MRPDLTRQNLQSVGRTDATAPAIVGRFVFEKVVFPHGSTRQVCFTRKQYLFANVFRQSMDLGSACETSGLTREQALRFIKRPDVVVWMNSREQMDMTKRHWSAPEKWWSEGNRMFEDPVVSPKLKVEIWKEFGDRACPKPTRDPNQNQSPKVVINIDPGAVQEAFRRQQSIEAQIVKESAA